MKKFVILADSCSDLPAELREKYDIDYVPMHFSTDDKEYVADLDYKEISVWDFYAMMRSGKRVITSQVNAAQFEERFEQLIGEGYDILYIACSSGLSASVKASYPVRDAMLAKYPDSKIICVDSLISTAALAAMCIKASKLRAEGKTIEQVAEWLEANKLNFNQEATVDDLKYLKQAGRVSTFKAIFGTLLNKKPIIVSDSKGRNASIETVKGRKASLARLAERFSEEYEQSDIPLFICHTDVPEEANALKEMVFEKLREKKIDPDSLEVYTTHIGPIVGASAGPGTIGVFFYGKEVTFDAEA